MLKNVSSKKIQTCDVIVAGGGIAGVCTALTLAEAGYHVVLLEKRHDVLEGTSNITPGRMSLGIHYLSDFHTAEYNLCRTLEFIKTFRDCFPDCFIRGSEYDNWQFGLYALVHDSLISPRQALNVLESLKERYKTIIKEPEFNFLTSFYGDAHDFYEKLNIDSYKSINTKHISLLLRTKEMLLNWRKFKYILKNRLISNPLINTIKLADVTNIRDGYQFYNHELSYFDSESKQQTYLTNFVVLCTWENIEDININSGITPSLITNRIKFLAHVKVPENLSLHPSTFFCLGPFAMFSNMGDGTAKITYAPKTNFIYSCDSNTVRLRSHTM